jgi:hypothetical protein
MYTFGLKIRSGASYKQNVVLVILEELIQQDYVTTNFLHDSTTK